MCVITVVFNIDQFVKVVCARFLHCEVTTSFILCSLEGEGN